MLTTVEGVYSSGKVELLETPREVQEGRVLVVFLQESKPKSSSQQMRFGQFAGSRQSTEEDFREAEWHGEKEFDALDGN